MHGEGHLLLPNGDVYRGSFKAGRLDGKGVYIDAAGRLYDDGFVAGLRHGPAQVVEVNGTAFASVWIAGIEDEAQRAAASESWVKMWHVQARTGPIGLAISVSLAGETQFCCHSLGPPIFGYAATSYTDRLEILPDAPRMLDVWRGHANVVVPDPLRFNAGRSIAEEYSWFNYNSKNYNKKLTLQFGLENRTKRPVTILGGYLDVARSQVDLQPALQVTQLTPIKGQSIDFSIENYGWSAANNARLTFRFQAPGERRTEPANINIGDITGVNQFSFAPALEQYGVRVPQLPRLAEACESKPEGNQVCLSKIIGSGVFGRLSDFVVSDQRYFGFRAVGQLDYEWRDVENRRQSVSAPFEALIPIGSFQSNAECEGGDFQDIDSGRPFVFEENIRGYRVPFPLQATVDAGAIKHWRIVLDAAKSSQHEMNISLQLADGQEVVSRAISLLIFRPKSYPASVRPFEASCR
jgi:hypothetical protein